MTKNSFYEQNSLGSMHVGTMQYVGQYCILPANTKFASVFVIVIHSEWRIEGGGGGGTGGLCSPHPFLDLFFFKDKK